MEYKIVLGTLGAVLTLAAHIPYTIDILKGQTKPHVFSWIIWTIIGATGLAAQLSEHGGAGAWATGGDVLASIIVVVLCVWYGTRDITRVDIASFALGIVAIGLWVLTNDPLWAVIFVILADALGFVSTFRKSHLNPHHETALTYLMVLLGYTAGLMALEDFSLTTALYPLYLVIGNGTLCLFLLIRKRQLKTHAQS